MTLFVLITEHIDPASLRHVRVPRRGPRAEVIPASHSEQRSAPDRCFRGASVAARSDSLEFMLM